MTDNIRALFDTCAAALPTSQQTYLPAATATVTQMQAAHLLLFNNIGRLETFARDAACLVTAHDPRFRTHCAEAMRSNFTLFGEQSFRLEEELHQERASDVSLIDHYAQHALLGVTARDMFTQARAQDTGVAMKMWGFSLAAGLHPHNSVVKADMSAPRELLYARMNLRMTYGPTVRFHLIN